MPDRPGPSEVRIREMTAADAAVIAAWRYDGPWSVYDGRQTDDRSAGAGYHAVDDGATGRLVGVVCLGADARVPGMSDEPGVVDVGIGLAPAMVGRGLGSSVARMVLAWIDERTAGAELRAVVQAWNQRSLRLCARAGFVAVGHHDVAPAGPPASAAKQDAPASVGARTRYVVLRRPRRSPA